MANLVINRTPETWGRAEAPGIMFFPRRTPTSQRDGTKLYRGQYYSNAY
jgi:hypothetical protein